MYCGVLPDRAKGATFPALNFVGMFHPVTGHEDPQGEYNSTLFLNSALEVGEGSASRPGGWVGLRAGLDGCGKTRPHRDSIPGPSSP